MKKYLFILINVLSFVYKTEAQNKPFVVGKSQPVLRQTNTRRLYFPINPNDTSIISVFENQWYSQQLLAMKEPVLKNNKSQDEIYRFTWLRSFHHPIAIRVERHNISYTLYWKMCDGAGGYTPGKLITDKHKAINKSTWDSFENRINHLDFWKMSTNEKDQTGTDGAQWILEEKIVGKYHVVVRWSPQEKTDYYKCCDYLISLTDLNIPIHDKY